MARGWSAVATMAACACGMPRMGRCYSNCWSIMGWSPALARSPDGTRLASAGGGQGQGDSGELFVWDVQSGERVRIFAGHRGVVYAVTWGPSGDLLVSGGSDGALRWWDVQRGECVRIREAHEGAIRSLRISPDGR